MGKSSHISMRIDPDTKERAHELFGSLGITLTDAVTLFLNQSLIEGGLPFSIANPNKMDESRARTGSAAK